MSVVVEVAISIAHLQRLNLVQALSILDQLCEGVVAAASRHALHLLANLYSQDHIHKQTRSGPVCRQPHQRSRRHAGQRADS